MILRVQDCYPNIQCPYCDAKLEVENTYEDRVEDCEGTARCPSCMEDIYIEVITSFVGRKVA
jgi:hypothetical protein